MPPPKIDVSFVAAMEDVLTVYEQPHDPDYPQVCLDEKLVARHGDVVEPLPVQPGRPERVDYEYERVSTANLSVMMERVSGHRHVGVTERRTAADYPRQLQWLADVRYPQGKKIRLVQDNLNTHRLATLYLVLPPEEARRLTERFDVHYTPTHASWLKMAETDIRIFERGCLRRRVPCVGTLRQRVAALETERKTAQPTIDWRFTTGDARVRLPRLYLSLESSETTMSNTCSD